MKELTYTIEGNSNTGELEIFGGIDKHNPKTLFLEKGETVNFIETLLEHLSLDELNDLDFLVQEAIFACADNGDIGQ